MMLRRLTGLLTAASMLHLTVVASDAACATHMMSGEIMMDGAPMTADAAGMSAEMSDRAQTDDAQASRHCDTPVQPDCCSALASCASTFAVASSISDAPAIEHGAIAQGVVDMPLSELVAPATPPPKA